MAGAGETERAAMGGGSLDPGRQTTLSMFRRGATESSDAIPRKATDSQIRAGTQTSVATQPRLGSSSSDGQTVLPLVVHAACNTKTMDPMLANSLENYWGDYYLACRSKRTGPATVKGSRPRRSERGALLHRFGVDGSDSDGDGELGRRSESSQEMDGLRFVEMVSKLSSSRVSSIPHEIVEKVLKIVGNHPCHNHLLLLSHEAYLCLRRLHQARPPTRAVASKVELAGSEVVQGLQLVVDTGAWSPLSLDRCMNGEDAVMDGSDLEATPSRARPSGKGRRNRASAWHAYAGKVESLLNAYLELEKGVELSEEAARAAEGTTLALRHLTNVLGDDLEARVRVCRYYRSLPREEARRRTGMSLKQARYVLTESHMCSLFSLTHKTVDGGGGTICLKSFVHKVLRLRLAAARHLRWGEGGPLASGLTREVCDLAETIFNLTYTLYAEIECCVDHSEYGAVENDRKALDTWVSNLFFNRLVLGTTWDKNTLLQGFRDPQHKLRFIGELVAQCISNFSSVPENLITLREAAKMKGSMTMSYR